MEATRRCVFLQKNRYFVGSDQLQAEHLFTIKNTEKNTCPERYGRVWSQWDLLKVFTRFDAVGGVVWQKWKSMLPWLPGVSGMSEGAPGARGSRLKRQNYAFFLSLTKLKNTPE